jgi:hypothetical protein
VIWIDRHLGGLDPDFLDRIRLAEEQIAWVRDSSAKDLFDLAMRTMGLAPIQCPFRDMTAAQLGDTPSATLVAELEPCFEPGMATASDLADQIQLCRAFADPRSVTDTVRRTVEEAVARFPASAEDLKIGHNPGDVLDPFILAANYELLSERHMEKAIESSASHKILMKVEDLVGNLHQNVIGLMRGNFRVPEPQGSRSSGKERLDPRLNPFPGADVGQVPVPEKPDTMRLFQVKSKTGSAKGGDGKRLGEQLRTLEATYGADTFYTAVVGNTLRGHRSKGAVLRESPNTAVLVGEAALDELTQSAVGGELLLRTYQRAFRQASQSAGYRFCEVVAAMVEVFEREAVEAGEDFLAAWLHKAIGGRRADQDSRAHEVQERLL